jgi:hypothetical protein
MPKVSSSAGVRVEGLNEVNKALRALGGREFQSELRDAGKEVATHVASDARGRAQSLGGVAAHVAPSISAAAGFTSAGVSFGGGAHPAAMGAEFGGQGRPTTMQFQPHRGHEGYFIYPSIRDNGEFIERTYLDAVDDILRRHGLD